MRLTRVLNFLTFARYTNFLQPFTTKVLPLKTMKNGELSLPVFYY
jgi:hypothetical protein